MGLRPREMYELVVTYKKQKKRLILMRQYYMDKDRIPVEILDYDIRMDKVDYREANHNKKNDGPSYIFFKPKDRSERKMLEMLYA